MKIAILYICTGKYSIFWEGFFKSAEKYFLPNHQKNYFVFTDQTISPICSNVHIIEQEKLGWPFDTLLRFHMFYDCINELKKFDYMFFFNANMRCVNLIQDDILPKKEGLMAALHPGFYNKSRALFTYETNPMSLAYIPPEKGEHYFMGSFNGGKSSSFIKLINVLSEKIERDLENGIIAIWFDESHLNHYLLDKPVKILSPSYAFSEGFSLPFERKVLILNKNDFGGHDFLREI
jgi:hypothetical protein